MAIKQWELPADKYGKIVQMTPTGVALARTIDASISASTEITLNANTTWIRVYAITKDVYLRWGIEDIDTNTFDEVIIAGLYLDLVVPLQADGTSYTAINVIEREASATVIVLEK